MEDIKIYSPIDGKYLGSVKSMTKEHIDNIINELNDNFENYKNIPIFDRAKMIEKFADELDKNTEKLANILCREISKSYNDSVSEIKRSVEMVRYIVAEALRLNGELYEGDGYGAKDKLAIVKREPIGVVLCISPYNYPVNLSLSKIIPALIMGNVVLFKPPTQGSLTCTMLYEILTKFVPENSIKIVTGKGSIIGDYINTHDLVKFINFTGSTQVGKSISQSTCMKGLLMELGGKDAAIVLEDADLKKASKEIVKGAFSYSGQRCTAIKRVLVVDKVAGELVKYLKEEVLKLKVGDPFDNADITPLIDNKSADYVYSLIEDAISKKAEVIVEPKRENNLIWPTLLDKVSLESKLAFEEPFGPVLPIIRVSCVDEAIKIANMSEYGLQSSVFTKDMEKAFYVAKRLQVGTVHINNKTQRGPDSFPFLGIKDSGTGVQGIRYSLLSMTNIKSIVFDF